MMNRTSSDRSVFPDSLWKNAREIRLYTLIFLPYANRFCYNGEESNSFIFVIFLPVKAEHLERR